MAPDPPRRRLQSTPEPPRRRPSARDPDSPERGPGMRFASLACEQDPGLSCDLGEHGRTDLAFRAGTRNQLPELVDPRALFRNPLLHGFVRVLSASSRKELNSQ